MKLLIKNMVCPRCISAVKDILMSEDLTVMSITLGEAETAEDLSDSQRHAVAERLHAIGFELLDDPRSQLVEQIRIAVRPKLSDYLSCRLHREYSSLSKLFSEVRGITIERFAIHHRVEYAKELLCYSSLTTSQIAYRLGYGSPTYLSSQFKQVTGMTPREFRELEIHRRTALDAL